MKLAETDPRISRVRDHLAMAIRLRRTASKLKTAQGQAKLTQLAALYEHLSLVFLEEDCVRADEAAPKLPTAIESHIEILRFTESAKPC